MLHSQAFCARVGLVAQLAATGILRLLSKSPATGWDRATVKFRRRTILLLRARWLWITLTTVVSHVSIYALLLTALRAVGVGQSEVSWIEVLAVFSFARLVTAVPLTPGGLGIVELALIGGLSAAGGPRAEVAAAVLIFRALTFVLPIPLGLLTYLYWKRNTSWRRPPGTAPRTELVPEDTSSPMGADSAAAGTVSAGTVARDVRTTSAEQITKERYSSPGAGRSSPPKATFSRPWWVAGLAAGGLLVLVLAALPVDTHSVAGWERGIFRGVNNPTFLPFVLVWPVMQLGNFVVVPASGLVALALRRFRLAAALLIGGGLVYWLAKVVKHQVTRGRPFQLLPNVHIHGAASLGLGFPSGHAAVAVLVATVCWPYLRRRGRIVAATLAVLVCLARMYVGAHLPLDILAGAALGLAVGAALDVGLGYAATREEQPVPT
jgi:membrane-associated phospholipid phosphatase